MKYCLWINTNSQQWYTKYRNLKKGRTKENSNKKKKHIIMYGYVGRFYLCLVLRRFNLQT